jgi:hypothetical protein
MAQIAAKVGAAGVYQICIILQYACIASLLDASKGVERISLGGLLRRPTDVLCLPGKIKYAETNGKSTGSAAHARRGSTREMLQ